MRRGACEGNHPSGAEEEKREEARGHGGLGLSGFPGWERLCGGCKDSGAGGSLRLAELGPPDPHESKSITQGQRAGLGNCTASLVATLRCFPGAGPRPAGLPGRNAVIPRNARDQAPPIHRRCVWCVVCVCACEHMRVSEQGCDEYDTCGA